VADQGSAMTSRALSYLRHEVARERRAAQSIADPLAQARTLDLLSVFDRRLDAAVLMDREDRRAQGSQGHE
jgi:hypothetical protein